MPTRNVVLTDRQASMVDALVRSGRYQNASEVLREGLRMVEMRHLEEAAKLDALRVAVDVGIAELDRGDYVAFADANEMLVHLTKLTDAVLYGETDKI